MECLGLDITKPYEDLYSFDSREVKCLRIIKYLMVSLHQILEKNLVMDVVMTNVPPKFGMLLSRSWETKLQGTLQMDLSLFPPLESPSLLENFFGGFLILRWDSL